MKRLADRLSDIKATADDVEAGIAGGGDLEDVRREIGNLAGAVGELTEIVIEQEKALANIGNHPALV